MFEDIRVTFTTSSLFLSALYSLEAYFSCRVFNKCCGDFCTTLPLKNCLTFVLSIATFLQYSSDEEEERSE